MHAHDVPRDSVSWSLRRVSSPQSSPMEGWKEWTPQEASITHHLHPDGKSMNASSRGEGFSYSQHMQAAPKSLRTQNGYGLPIEKFPSPAGEGEQPCCGKRGRFRWRRLPPGPAHAEAAQQLGGCSFFAGLGMQ